MFPIWLGVENRCIFVVDNGELLRVVVDIVLGGAIKAQSKEASLPPPTVGEGDALTSIKHLLLPVIDRNPYLSEGTRQVCFSTPPPPLPLPLPLHLCERNWCLGIGVIRLLLQQLVWQPSMELISLL